jgi:hypothetical protein
VRSCVAWDDDHYAPRGPRRLFLHVVDDAPIDRCSVAVTLEVTVVAPGPGLALPTADDDPVTAALVRPHRLLQPIRA